MKGTKYTLRSKQFESFLATLSGKNAIILNTLVLFLAISVFTSCQKDDDITEEEVEETEPAVTFILTDTGQDVFYDADGNEISAPGEGDDYYGQDAQYSGTASSFEDNGDGTVTDLNTGLMWQQTPDFERHNYYDAFDYVESLEIGGYTDWRLPTIKELYSLLNSNGELDATNTSDSQPYLYDEYFDFEYDENIPYAGQYWSSTKYVKGGLQTDNIEGAFGFNFADGHIKSYETGLYFDGSSGVQDPGCFVRAVRGEENVYGVNDFVDNGDGTVTDQATGLIWQQTDDGNTYDWVEALALASESEVAGYTDWRLPNTKELQSIVDYEKTTFPAIDETYFSCTDSDSWFWTSTTQGDFKYTACYIAFGKAYSRDNSSATEYYDWHGAGAQRSDPKAGVVDDYLMESDNADDLLRIRNYVRLVRN
ncbi:Lcl C-terminal domain-containing protein [Saccharicrinis sp. GN24d3]|uniref:Lcl C-terminal domain-containing protein n=1 Tax=Saccharicrinis sp. GN24d3 TaxID=3458416 RepID=UPI004035735C